MYIKKKKIVVTEVQKSPYSFLRLNHTKKFLRKRSTFKRNDLTIHCTYTEKYILPFLRLFEWIQPTKKKKDFLQTYLFSLRCCFFLRKTLLTRNNRKAALSMVKPGEEDTEESFLSSLSMPPRCILREQNNHTDLNYYRRYRRGGTFTRNLE